MAWARLVWELWRDTLRGWADRIERRAACRWPEPPPPVLILEPIQACPSCGYFGAPQAWLSANRARWMLRCWECGYTWPQGDGWRDWQAIRGK